VPDRKKRHIDVIQEHLNLPGASLLDVGCGDGALARRLSELGSWSVGLESSPGQIQRAQSAKNGNRVPFVLGRGEALPFGDGRFDYVLFFNSLHHIPLEAQEAALEEAARILRPGGRIYIAEPLAEGSNFEASREVEDETVVRTAAQAAIAKATDDTGLTCAWQERYLVERGFSDFESFAAEMIAVDERRQAVFAARTEKIRAAFFRHAKKDVKGYLLEQSMTLSILEKAA
jgi:ubiquinone/menaquinone biosynthesis C-methylase UbiE